MAYLTSQTKKEIQEIIREFGFSSEKEFVSQAVKEKLMELKKLRFFLISEKIRKGLEKKGIKPEELLKKFKS
jgi:AraC-like DNA-binding protein